MPGIVPAWTPHHQIAAPYITCFCVGRAPGGFLRPLPGPGAAADSQPPKAVRVTMARLCHSAHGSFLPPFGGQENSPLCECFAFVMRFPAKLLESSRSHSRGTSPFALFALLLLSAPDGFTLRTLLAFHGLTEPSHQLRAAGPPANGVNPNDCLPLLPPPPAI